jgi:hypothetical protein
MSAAITRALSHVEPNPSAAPDGQRGAGLSQVGNATRSAEAAFYITQVGEQGASLAGTFFRSPGCSELSEVFGKAAPLFAFPRAIEIIPEVLEAGEEWRNAPAGLLRTRAGYAATARGAEVIAVAATCGAVLTEGTTFGKVVGKVGDVASLVSDVCDGRNAAQDFSLANGELARLNTKWNTPVPVALKQSLEGTKKHALLRLIRSVCIIAAGIFTVGSLLFGAALISSTALSALTLVGAVFGLVGLIYKQGLRYQPINMVAYQQTV